MSSQQSAPPASPTHPGQPGQYVAPPPTVQYVVLERPRPRIAQGFGLLIVAALTSWIGSLVFAGATGGFAVVGATLSALISALVALVIFAMGQSVWGALWRSWVVTAIIAVVLTLIL